jgi:hypothetical protein
LSLLPVFVCAFLYIVPSNGFAVSRIVNVRRRVDYHRQKLATGPEYRQGVGESQKQWREEHPNYNRNENADLDFP